MTRRSSPWGTVAFLLSAASLSGCAQNIVLEDQIDGGGTSPANDGSFGDGHCFGGLPLQFTPAAPEVVIALDRSTAMNEPFGNDPSQLSSAIETLDAQVLRFTQTQNSPPLIRFAFIDFPDTANDCNGTLGCCSNDVTPIASLAAFEAATGGACSPANSCLASAQRPTANALSKAQAFLSNDPQPGQHYVLLVTDGPPTGCNAMGMDCTDALGALSKSVQTTIVSIGGDASPAGCLLNLASAEGAQGPPFYYAASTPNQLTMMIASITNLMAEDACRLDLSTPANAPDQLSVVFQSTQSTQSTFVPRDVSHSNGWDINGNGSRLTLYGPACTALVQNGAGSFQILDGCSGGHGGQSAF